MRAEEMLLSSFFLIHDEKGHFITSTKTSPGSNNSESTEEMLSECKRGK